MSLSAPSTLTRDAIGQGISAVGERILSPEWRGQASVELSLNQARLGLQEERSAGQTVGLMGRWSRTAALGASEWAAELGPLFGLLEPAGGGTDFGYGLHGRGRWGRQTIGQRLGAEYAIEFADNLHGTPGWTLTQHVTGEAERELDRDTRVRASLTVAAARAHVDLFGSNATRDVLFTGTISRRRGQVGIEAGLRDGASSAVQMGGGDGLFIPAPFQSHSRYVGLNGGLGLTSHLNAFARVRYASLSAPEVPDQREASATGGFGYAYGQFLFTLEDRYIAGGTSNLDNRSNVIMIVASRALGARF